MCRPEIFLLFSVHSFVLTFPSLLLLVPISIVSKLLYAVILYVYRIAFDYIAFSTCRCTFKFQKR